MLRLCTRLLVGVLLALAGSLTWSGAHAGLMTGQRLTVAGVQRSYDLYVPDELGQGPVALVFMFHGHMGRSAVMTGANDRAAPYKRWLDLAARHKFIVVAPQGEKGADGYRGWNDCRADAQTNPRTDDLAFVDAMLAALRVRYPIDTARIYATGTSNGGNFCYRLAQERSEVFAAVAPVVAAMPARNKCQIPSRPVSVLIMNGTADPILPYAGGPVGRRQRDQQQRGSVLSTEDSVKYWVTHNGTETKPVIGTLADVEPDDGGQVSVATYGSGRAGTEVVLYRVQGGGHTEPSLSEHYGWLYRRVVGPQNHDIEMADVVWRFFQRHQRIHDADVPSNRVQ
ncbi:MAG: hypothetical protein AMJ69_10865 [Gammaproteobacteria bacterium SG8_47]|nr:MAG: hypothetical protein AMJ69_10865 [Gammaproteobacteria bacterium SG8_47]